MIWIDWGIIGLISIYAVVGLIRGFATEAVSLITWTVAFWVGLTFSQGLSIYFRSLISQGSARLALCFALLFLLTLMLGRLIRFILRQIFRSTGLSQSDRFAGLIFGTARGVLLVAIFVMLAGLTSLPRDPWWQESNLISPFEARALWLKSQIRTGIAGRIDYGH